MFLRDHLVKRNHYNPCFWTALWNPEYYDAFVEGVAGKGRARKQVVYVLNLLSCKIYQTTVDNVHYDKNLGVAELTPASMKRFAARWFPDKYRELAEYVQEHPESLFIDFEDILDAVERVGGYASLLRAARIGGIASAEHKGFLTVLLVIHAMRSHEMMSAMVGPSGFAGMDRFEYFWVLKNAWGDPLFLARACQALAGARWVLYRTADHRFPLCDSPVMFARNRLTAILSPRLLLVIHLSKAAREEPWEVTDRISPRRLQEFRRLAIANTWKEIVFHDPDELGRWRSLPELRERSRILGEPEAARELTATAAARVLWACDGFGRIGPDFEDWVKPHLGL